MGRRFDSFSCARTLQMVAEFEMASVENYELITRDAFERVNTIIRLAQEK